MDRKDFLGIPEEVSSISGELYAAINKAVGDPKWRDDVYKEYLASLKENRIEQVDTEEEKTKNQESMCVEIQAALDYLPAKENKNNSYCKDVTEAAHTAITELDLGGGKYQEIVTKNPEISERSKSFVQIIKDNAKKFAIAALMASFLVASPLSAGKFSLTKEAEALDVGRMIVSGALSAIASSTSISYSDGEFDFDFDGEDFGDTIGRRVKSEIEYSIDDVLSGAKRGYEDRRDYQARVKKAANNMANYLEGMSVSERKVALRTFVMAHEMGGTNKTESAVLAQINNATAGSGLDKTQLQDVNLFLQEVTNNYKYSGTRKYSIEDSYAAAIAFLKKDDEYDREKDMLKTMLTTATLTAQSIKNENVKTANVLLGMMERMYDSSKEYYDSSSMRKLVKETRKAVKAAAEKYSTRDTVARYDLGAIDVEPNLRNMKASREAEDSGSKTLSEKVAKIRQDIAEREAMFDSRG